MGDVRAGGRQSGRGDVTAAARQPISGRRSTQGLSDKACPAVIAATLAGNANKGKAGRPPRAVGRRRHGVAGTSETRASRASILSRSQPSRDRVCLCRPLKATPEEAGISRSRHRCGGFECSTDTEAQGGPRQAPDGRNQGRPRREVRQHYPARGLAYPWAYPRLLAVRAVYPGSARAPRRIAACACMCSTPSKYGQWAKQRGVALIGAMEAGRQWPAGHTRRRRTGAATPRLAQAAPQEAL